MKKRLDSSLSRRNFVKSSVATVAGLSLTNAFGFPSIIKNFQKPDSRFNGVQIGVISYSFRSLPVNAEQLLKYCVDTNISALELLGNTAEAFAGAPHTTTEPRQFPAGGQRPQQTPEQIAEQETRARELAEWRAKASMDKFAQLKK